MAESWVGNEALFFVTFLKGRHRNLEVELP